MTTEDEEGLKSLLLWAGRRPAPPGEVASEVYQRIHLAWKAQVQRRETRRRGYAWAAGVVAFVVASWGAWNLYPHEIVATVRPGQTLLITHAFWHPFAGRRGGELYEGDALLTGPAGAVLHRTDGNELSLSGNTRVSFASASTVYLWYGRLYVQTYGGPRTRHLVVSTDLGSIEHLGTQFLVERETDALLVAVRDGRVAMHYRRHEALELQDGQAARVDLQGRLRRWYLAAFDDIWNWADGLAPPLVIEGQSLYTVLSRIAQRSGLVLRFSTEAAETTAHNLALHSPPLVLQPREALAAVLATTSLSGKIAGREILVSAP